MLRPPVEVPPDKHVDAFILGEVRFEGVSVEAMRARIEQAGLGV